MSTENQPSDVSLPAAPAPTAPQAPPVPSPGPKPSPTSPAAEFDLSDLDIPQRPEKFTADTGWRELHKTRARLSAEKERADAAERARVVESERFVADLARERARTERAVGFATAGLQHPSFKHVEVQDFVSSQYDAYRGREGESAKPFGSWLEEVAPSSPLLAPYFSAPAGQPAASPRAPVADPNKGAGGTAGPAPGALTGADIRRMRQSGEWTAEQKKAAAAKLGVPESFWDRKG